MTWRLALAAFLLPLLAGCGTLANTFEDEPKNKIYIGVRSDFGEWAFGHGGIIDWPFSLVLDTIFLPYTIPRTIANYAAEDEEEEEDSRQPSAISRQPSAVSYQQGADG